MNKKIKNFLSLGMVICFSCSTLNVNADFLDKDYHMVNVKKQVVSEIDLGMIQTEDSLGTTENTVDYTFENGVLTFSGKGTIMNVETDNPWNNPWQQYKNSIKKIVIKDGITGLDYGLFMGYEKLQEIDFGNTLNYIGEHVFLGCTSLEEVVLPDGITFYGAGIFDNCTNLKSVSFGSTPEGASVIYGTAMFVRTPNLQKITVPENHLVFEAVDNVLYDKVSKALVAYPGGCTNTSYTVKEGTEKIIRFAFSNNNHLEEIHFPDSLKFLDTCSFYIVENLDNVCFPSSVEDFCGGEEIFCSCPSLKKVTNLSKAKCYLGEGTVEVFSPMVGRPTAYWYSITHNKYISEIKNEEAVLKVVGQPPVPNETFELNGVTYKVASWMDGVKEIYDTIGYSDAESIAKRVNKINDLKETAGYVTMESDSNKNGEIPKTVNYENWNYIVLNETTDTQKPHQKGDSIVEKKTKGVYLVTKVEKKEGTVTYSKSTDKKATKVKIPNTIKINGVSYKVTAIADNAFKNYKKMTSVEIGSNITKIGKNTFAACKNLKLITINSKKLKGKNISTNAFKGVPTKATVKVPKGKLKTYKKLLQKKGLNKKVKVK